MAVWVGLNGKRARADLDGGSTNSIFNDRFVSLHKIPVKYYKKPATTNFAFRGSRGTIKAYVDIPVTFGGEVVGKSVFPVGALDGWDALIGSDIMVQ